MPLLPKTNAKLSYKESYKAKLMLRCKQEFANYFQIFEYVQSFDKALPACTTRMVKRKVVVKQFYK